ncbi:MAG: hypothetical protein B0A82_19160 [Alkalinema sp. CACIAM 70d]|nr:MAG: hypothetical protein B0A82_19160 [Alkalinema sp. CACIAM 70d]
MLARLWKSERIADKKLIGLYEPLVGHLLIGTAGSAIVSVWITATEWITPTENDFKQESQNSFL